MLRNHPVIEAGIQVCAAERLIAEQFGTLEAIGDDSDRFKQLCSAQNTLRCALDKQAEVMLRRAVAAGVDASVWTDLLLHSEGDFVTYWRDFLPRIHVAIAEVEQSESHSAAATGNPMTIDDRMTLMVKNSPESVYWNSPQWAQHLNCSAGYVRKTPTWQRLASLKASGADAYRRGDIA